MNEFWSHLAATLMGAVIALATLTYVIATKVEAGSVDTDGYVLKRTWHCF